MARPSLYKPEYCQALVEHMREGYSFESFSATIGTHRDTLYEWCKVHDEFSDAKKHGFELSTLWWEKILRAHAVGKIKNGAATAIFTMKCRFGYKEQQDVNMNHDIQLSYSLDDSDTE